MSATATSQVGSVASIDNSLLKAKREKDAFILSPQVGEVIAEPARISEAEMEKKAKQME